MECRNVCVEGETEAVEREAWGGIPGIEVILPRLGGGADCGCMFVFTSSSLRCGPLLHRGMTMGVSGYPTICLVLTRYLVSQMPAPDFEQLADPSDACSVADA